MGTSNNGASNSKNKKHFTVPIAAIFALGCLIIIAAFTAVSTYSGMTFSQNVKGAVDDNLELALRGAIQAIQSPLEESQRYISRLTTKLENNETGYPLDDEDPTSLTPQSAFYSDAMMTAYQRPEISSIYQLRRSTRYEHSPGSGVDTVALVTMPDFQLVQFANNTGTIVVGLTSLKSLANISALPSFSFPLNVSGTPYINIGLDTVGVRWVTGVLITSIVSTRISLLSQINVSGTTWAVGVDHNMTIFRDLMKQATAPFSIGITNPSKIVASGAHTSLYDLNGGVLMSTSITSITLHTSARELWPAGGTPSGEINTAYTHAISMCPSSSTSCTANPKLVEIDGQLVGVVRLHEVSSGLDLLLVSSVPRKHFFGEADRSLAVSIGVAVACCVVIVAGCIAVLVAIGPALRRLQENMLLASVLQNHLVEHTPSRLTDIAKLSAVFDEMNQRLLIARSFVPEAVLLGEEDMDEGEDANDTTSHVETNVISENSRRISQVRSGGVDSNRSSLFQKSMLHREQEKASSQESQSTEAQDPTLINRLFTMNEKRVAVLSLNMVGFSGLVAEQGGTRTQRVSDVSSKLLTIVVQAAQRERGVMDSFHGDHFLLTFNASRAVASSLAAAVRTANAVAEDVRRDARLRGCMGVAAGAAIGKALVGTLGIDGHRRLSIIGNAYRQAIALQAVSSQFIQKTATHHNNASVSGCAIEESGLREIGDCGMYMQLIGRAVPPMGARNQTAKPVYAAHTKHHGQNEAATKSITADEWLYELDAIQAGDPFTDPNAALEALMSGNTDTCNQMLTANDCGGVHTPSFHGAVSGDSSSDVSGSGVMEASRNSITNTQLKVGWGPVEALYRQHIAGANQTTTIITPTFLGSERVTPTNGQQLPKPSLLSGGSHQNGDVWDHVLY